MHLGFLERVYVNSWFRHAVQRPFELAALHKLHPFPAQAAVLDVGCGNGKALMALAKGYHPLSLAGVDADAAQVARARDNLQQAGLVAHLQQAEAEALPLPAQTYDVVTGFGVVHHVPEWQKAVGEIARVLRHGGVYYAIEFYSPLLENTLFKRLFKHPPHRFTHAQFVQAVQEKGLQILQDKHIAGLFGLVVARRIAEGNYD